MKELIRCSNLHFSYNEKEILHGIDFSVQQGGIVGLLGKNGAGKSTTINILMGFLQPDAGECTVLGYPSHSIPPSARKRIGLLHEGFIQYDFMSIEEIERYYAPYYPGWNNALYYDLVDRMRVPHSRKVARLSCGQRSQVTLGLILAQRPDLMILDDFSMGLDVGYRRLFLEFLRDYVDQHATTVLLTSHIVQELDSFLDEIVIVQEGSIIVSKKKDEFMNSFFCYSLQGDDHLQIVPAGPVMRVERGKGKTCVYGFADIQTMQHHLRVQCSLPDAELTRIPLSFEDAFIGLTGRY